MSYRELYREYRQEVEERYPLVMERIAAIREEETTREPFLDYFHKTAAFITQMYQIEQAVEAGSFF